jgi:sodium transport system ATP-binding protein
MNAVIEAKDLSKVFKGPKGQSVTALDRVNFTCRAGEVYGLLGPNGAGKTTTLRILSTALKPTSGSATVDGVDVVQNPGEVRRRIGFLSGTTGIYGRLTAREMVQYFGRLYGMEENAINARTDEIFSMLDMHEFAKRRGDKLSTGMKQKVNIARTIVHHPNVVVFDEPTSGLDVITSRAIIELIDQCRREGKGVLFSTHIMAEAEKLCDRIGILHKGKIYAEGTKDEILAKAGKGDLEEAFLALIGEEVAS